MKNGYARVKILSNAVHLRFEQIDIPGKSGTFDLLRDKLYHEILQARWDQRIRWMIIPLSKLNAVFNFCYRELGVGYVRIENHTAQGHSHQPPLRF